MSEKMKQQEMKGVFNVAVGGFASAEVEDTLLEDVRKFVASHPEVVSTGWGSTNQKQVKLK